MLLVHLEFSNLNDDDIPFRQEKHTSERKTSNVNLNKRFHIKAMILR